MSELSPQQLDEIRQRALSTVADDQSSREDVLSLVQQVERLQARIRRMEAYQVSAKLDAASRHRYLTPSLRLR